MIKRILIVISTILVVTIAPLIFYINQEIGLNVVNSICLNALTILLALFIFSRFQFFPQIQPIRYIVPISISCYSFSTLILVISRIEYSNKIIIFGFLMLPLLLLVFNGLAKSKKVSNLYYVPYGETTNLKDTDFFKFKRLDYPFTTGDLSDGLIVDFRYKSLNPAWEKFLVECVFKKIPIYNYLQIKESITGQVEASHLVDNDFGTLEPSKMVFIAKRLIDLIFVILVAPIAVPISLMIAFFVALDSKGGVLFTQERVGLDGKPFLLFKFRSMRTDDVACIGADESVRITRVGKVIRRFRFDEIPQFLNVLKGDMSLIGPRPETVELVKEYEKKIPFFMYRHTVLPGISGWAQVMQGYTIGVDEKREKLAHDLYYIKHYSLWLDLFIWYKTIKTVFTGFGSK